MAAVWACASSANAWRAIHWLIRDAWRSHQLQEGSSVGTWEFEGGREFAAAVLGGEPEDYTRQVGREFVDIADMLMVKVKDAGGGGSWSAASGAVTPARGRRPALITLGLSPKLQPQVLKSWRTRHGDDKRLVPLTAEPRLVGRPNEHGPVLWLWRRIVEDITLASQSVASGLGGRIEPARLRTLARDTGVPWVTAKRHLALWTDGSAEAELVLVGPHGYSLTTVNEGPRRRIHNYGIKQLAGARGIRPPRKRKPKAKPKG
jgi:hypothetical protein